LFTIIAIDDIFIEEHQKESATKDTSGM